MERGERASGRIPRVSAIVVSKSGPNCNRQLATQLSSEEELLWIRTNACGDRRQKEGHGVEPEVVLELSPGLLAGRHRGVVQAASDILIFLDDDVSLPTGFVESILEPFADPDIHFVGCRYLPDYEHEPPSWMEGLWRENDDGCRTLGYLSLLDGGESQDLSAYIGMGSMLCCAPGNGNKTRRLSSGRVSVGAAAVQG